jgi:hypothetical protein
MYGTSLLAFFDIPYSLKLILVYNLLRKRNWLARWGSDRIMAGSNPGLDSEHILCLTTNNWFVGVSIT